jgi:hypothetical protein
MSETKYAAEIQRDNNLKQAADAALAEARSACARYEPFHSAHEGYAVILEELDELWVEAKERLPNKDRLAVEARHVAAMAIRFAAELT